MKIISQRNIANSNNCSSQLKWQKTPTGSLQRGKTLPHNECPVHNTQQSHGEVRIMMGLWGMQITP